MNIYRCNRCGKSYLDCDLMYTKCSENFLGTAKHEHCPNCMKKLIYVKLEKVASFPKKYYYSED